MHDKKRARIKRALRSRLKMRELGVIRLSVNRSSKHIYAQIINASGDRVIASASTLDKLFKEKATSNIEAAKQVGTLIAERAKAAGVDKIAFDRSGFRYHGRVKALADAVRDNGLKF